MLPEEALEYIGYCKFINEIQPKLRAEGKLVGIGIVAYAEGKDIGLYEGTKWYTRLVVFAALKWGYTALKSRQSSLSSSHPQRVTPTAGLHLAQ